MTEGRRYNEDAYEDLLTLDALAKSDIEPSSMVRRLFGLLHLMRRIRTEAPELWQSIKTFAEESRRNDEKIRDG